MLTMPPKVQFREVTRILEFVESNHAEIHCNDSVTIEMPDYPPIKAESLIQALNKVREEFM